MDNVSFAIGIARAMGSNRNSHPSGGLSCVAPLLFSRLLGHHSDPYRTPFQCLGKLSDITSESLSDIHRNRCPIWIGIRNMLRTSLASYSSQTSVERCSAVGQGALIILAE